MKKPFVHAKEKFLLCVLLAALLLANIAAIPIGVASAGETKLYVDPPRIVDPTLTPAKTFTVDVTVANVTNLYGFEFKLSYNTTILTCVGVMIVPFPNQTAYTSETDVNSDEGIIWVNVTYQPPAEPFNGSTPLARIFFQVKGMGSTVLDLYDTILVDSTATEILHSVEDGYFSNLLLSPVASFTYSPPLPLVNQTVTFNATDSYDPDGTIVSYAWDFDDGTTDSGVIVYHNFTAEGNYNVTLLVTDNDGLTDTIWDIVVVSPPEGWPPVANFTYSPVAPKVDHTVTFNASASYDVDGNIINYTWDFGDNTTDSGVIVYHNFTAIGAYNVTLVVTDNDGLTNTTWHIVDVGPLEGRPPVAIFDYSPVAPYVGQTVTFNASASYDPDGNITSYVWLFGDGTNRTGKIAKHAYTAAGSYIVVLVVTDNDGLTDACFKKVRVTVPPLSRIYVDPIKSGAAVGETFVVDVMVNITDPPGPGTGMFGFQYKLKWDNTTLKAIKIDTHTDGVPSTDLLPGWTSVFVAANETGSGPPKAPEGFDYHSYAVSATKGVAFTGVASLCTYTFQVVGNGSCALDIYDTILPSDYQATPIPHETVDGYFSNLSPLALFTYSPETPLVGDVVTFNATASYDVPPGYIMSYAWDFNSDGIIDAYGMIINHTYTAAGVHNVTLTVTDNDGLNDTAWKTVRVGRWPFAFFTYSPVPSPINQTVTFNATDSYDLDGNITNYTWDFGDNTTKTGMIANHTYTKVGLYTVTLTVTDNDGLNDTVLADVSVIVTGYPVASFTYSPVTPLVDQTVTFDASASYDPDGTIVSYAWNFGDGSPVAVTNDTIITHTYTAAGIYTVTLTVTDNDTLIDTYTKTVRVTLPPTKVYVDPERIGAAVNETFIINVNIYNVTNLYGFEFKLSYNTTILDGVNVTLPPGHFLTPTNSSNIRVYRLEVNDIIGLVWVNVSLLAPETPKNGSGILVTVTFNVTGVGSCFLHLHDTILVNSAAAEIPHYVEDGYFSNQFPIASFTYTPPIPLVDDVITFDASASSDVDGWIVNYTWAFGDGTTDSGVVVYHNFTAYGAYNVTLTVTDNDGLTGTVWKTVKVYQKPKIFGFTYSPLSPVVGDVVTFSATAVDFDGWIANYTWNFGDGNTTTTTETTITHIYTAVGLYNVTLTVTDNDGLTDTLRRTIGIGVPVAKFTYSPWIPLVNQTVAFDARESFDLDGWIVNYTWNFGDGTTATGKIVTHIYKAVGNYNVTLNVTDDDGLTDTVQRIVRVILPPPTRVYVDPEKIGVDVGETFVIKVNVYNVTDLHGFQLKLSYNTTILDIAEVTVHPVVKPPTYEAANEIHEDEGWYSLAIASLADPPGVNYSGPLVTLTFNVTGVGSCFLHLYDTILVDSTATEMPHYVGDGYFSNLSPLALFTYSPLIPLENETVTFDASASFDVDGWIVNYTWNFGDLNITTTPDPVITHVYTTTGTYTVTLTVTDNDTRTDTYTKTLKVETQEIGRPEAIFSYSPKTPIVNQTVTFNATASYDVPPGYIVSYAWDFGDGNVTIIGDNEPITPIITHTYTAASNYTVTLTVTDDEDLRDSATAEITVYARAVGWIEGTVTSAETLPIVGASVEADGYFGTTDASGYYKIEVPAPATYSVTASADGYGSQTVHNVFVNVGVSVTRDFALEPIVALSPPAASFTWSPSEPVVGKEVTFTSTSTDPDGTITGWEWDFNGDGVVDATTENATWTYDEAGTYNVTLTVTDNDGLTSTITHSITVQAAPPPQPPYALYLVAVMAIAVLASTAIYYLKKKR